MNSQVADSKVVEMTTRPRASPEDAVQGLAMRTIQATTPEEIDIARPLIKEYAAWLAIDLSFQNFDEELSTLPGHYAPPDGRLVLASFGTETAGCVALRRFDECRCEMKRMWVRPQFRGRHIGRALAEYVISEARDIGYCEMLLDSLPSLASALNLYKSLGFRVIGPYRYNPDPNAVFMRLLLR
jgi:ribosomal protein S18 acetylase RimI-like enzyme